MIKKDCRLERASKYFMGGGGGGTDINQLPGGFRNWGKEQKDLTKGYGFQEQQYGNFVQNDPLLSKASTGAQDFWGKLGGLTSPLYNAQSYYGDIIKNKGALTGDLLNSSLQQGRISGEQSGSLHDPSAIIRDYTSRTGTQEARLAGATQQAQGLAGGIQAAQNNALNQVVGVGNAAVSQYGGLTDPILSYISNIFGGNQQASIAQAQTNAQTAAAGSGKAGGAMAGIGSIIGAVLPLLFSDERIKTKIKDTGIKTDDDVPIKTFEYKTKPGVPYIGVMAQDVEKVRPDAVVTDPTSGVKMVNFWKVQVPMAQLNRGKR